LALAEAFIVGNSDELGILAVFSSVCPSSDLGWKPATSDPPDALSADGAIGIEVTRLAPAGSGRGGSPATRRQSQRDRVLVRAQRKLLSTPGRGFRVHVIWQDDGLDLSRYDSDALARDLADLASELASEAARRAAQEAAGELVLYRNDLPDGPLRQHVACLSGTTIWDCAGSGESVVLTSQRPLQTIIERKSADLSRWSVRTRERWLLVHLDPTTCTDDPAIIRGPYLAAFDRIFLLDTVELTCRELGCAPV